MNKKVKVKMNGNAKVNERKVYILICFVSKICVNLYII